MGDEYVTSAWKFGNRLATAYRAWKAPHIARAMLDAYDSGQAVVTVNCSTWRGADGTLTVNLRPGTLSVTLEPAPVLCIPRKTY